MKSGKLSHSIIIQKKVVLRNSFGEEEVTYEDFSLAYASIEPLTGREYFLAQQAQSSVDYKFTMRYRAGVRPDFRIKWGERIFNIISTINPDERNVTLIIYCKEFIT